VKGTALVTIAPEEILAGLQTDPRFSDQPELVLPYLSRLPEVLGERIGHIVTLKEYFEVVRDFVRDMLTQGLGDNNVFGLNPVVFDMLADELDEASGDLETVLHRNMLTETQVMLSERVGLNDQLKQLYVAGQLTFADMFRLQSGIFIPKPG
jgi:hypothetical protein